jgi:hypothetical protein
MIGRRLNHEQIVGVMVWRCILSFPLCWSVGARGGDGDAATK